MTHAGLVAEFDSAERLLAAVRWLRQAGYRELDAYTPFPVHGLEEAIGLERSGINWVVFPLALAGAAAALFIQWITNAWDYPLNVGGRPAFALPAFVPITFEMGILSAAFSAFFGLWWITRLPRLAHPLFEVPGFERATIDRFWLGVSPADPYFDEERTGRELRELGAARIETVPGSVP